MIGLGNWPPPDHPHRDRAEMYLVAVIGAFLTLALSAIFIALAVTGNLSH